MVDTMSTRSSMRCCNLPSSMALPTMSCGPPTRKPVADCWRADRPSRAHRRPVVRGRIADNGTIVIERADDVIAIRPGVGPQRVHLVAVALGEAHHVEPVPRPSARRKPATPAGDRPASRRHPRDVSSTNASISSGVGGKPGQVERDAANVGAAIRLRRRREFCALPAGRG